MNHRRLILAQAEEKNAPLSDEEREATRLLARMMWISTQRVNGNEAESSSPEMQKAWDEAKAEMLRVARMTIRRLEDRGIKLVQTT
jgi:hypothetical protein